MSHLVKVWKVKASYEVIEAKALCPVNSNSDRFPSDLFLRSKTSRFWGRTRYIVTVSQIIGTENVRFKLWTGYDHSEAKEAFDQMQATLLPILSKGTTPLTKHLLKEITLPSPLSPNSVVPRLVDALYVQPLCHPEWLEVVHVLLGIEEDPPSEPGMRGRYIKSLKEKYGSCNSPTDDIAVDGVRDLETWKSFFLRIFDKDKAMTSLFDAVENEQHRDSMDYVLSRVDTNDKHPLMSDTALHVAVRKGNLTLVKLLLAYQADPTITNTKGETPLDIGNQLTCRSAGDIVSALEKMKELQMKAKSYYSHNNELPQKRNSSDTFLLSLDGGGMRSVIMCHILAAIENRMKELCSSCQPLHSYFDYVAGTSAGAIIGAFLLYKSDIHVANAGIYMYKFMNEVFSCSKSNRSDKLKEFVTGVVGETTIMSDLPEGNMIITATVANTCPSKLHLMTNYGERRDGLLGPDERKLWEALIASSAAPTYFPSFDCFLDGGLMANNPTLPAMADIFDHSKKEGNRASIGLVLSLGTGYLDPPKEVKNFEVYVPGFSMDSVKMLFESSFGLMSLLNHFIEESTQSNGAVVHQANAWCQSIGATYSRLSPPLIEEVAPDMNSTDELIDLLYETELYVQQEYSQIDKIAKIILTK